MRTCPGSFFVFLFLSYYPRCTRQRINFKKTIGTGKIGCRRQDTLYGRRRLGEVLFFIGFRGATREYTLLFFSSSSSPPPPLQLSAPKMTRHVWRESRNRNTKTPPAHQPPTLAKLVISPPPRRAVHPSPMPCSPPSHRAHDRRPEGKEVLPRPAAGPRVSAAPSVLCDYTGRQPIEQTSMERDRRAEFRQRRSVEDLFSKRFTNTGPAVHTPPPSPRTSR